MDYLGPYALGPNETEWQGIYTGDARVLAKYIPDESVDLVLTDPVYEDASQYQWLTELAARVLKQDRALLAFIGIGYMPQTVIAMEGRGLSYRWRFIARPVYAKEFHGRLCVMTQECLWYQKGTSKPRQTIFDFDYSTNKGAYQFGGSNWGKSEDILTRYIETFSAPGGVVLDPFGGSGSTAAVCKKLGRKYLSFEVLQTSAERARFRVRNTQTPLLVLDTPQQLSLIA